MPIFYCTRRKLRQRPWKLLGSVQRPWKLCRQTAAEEARRWRWNGGQNWWKLLQKRWTLRQRRRQWHLKRWQWRRKQYNLDGGGGCDGSDDVVMHRVLLPASVKAAMVVKVSCRWKRRRRWRWKIYGGGCAVAVAVDAVVAEEDVAVKAVAAAWKILLQQRRWKRGSAE